MEMYNFIVENKEIIKLFYGLFVALICFFIVYKTNKLFKLSLHQGIRYFRNAFLFYGVAFLARYLFGAVAFYGFITTYAFIIKLVFEFFLIMGGFFLLYSLLWKKLESSEKPNVSSLLNLNIIIFYFMSFVIVILDYLWETYNLMFASQIIIFIIISVVSYLNFKKHKEKHFLKFYFIAMIFILFAWVLNSSLELFNFSNPILINVYIFNIVFFLLFLYGVIKLTK